MTSGLLLLVALAGAPAPHDCFRTHVEEAIALNTHRRELYAAATDGASRPISDRLIRAEHLSRVVATYFDVAARPYQRAGIPLLCAEFVPMSGAAALPLGADGAIDSTRVTGVGSAAPVEGAAVRARLRVAFETGGFHRLRWAAEWELLRLEHTPDRHCLVRHLVESVRRAAALAPVHAAAAREAGLPSPLPLSRRFVELQLAALAAAAELDGDAAPLQRAGVPILCADLPPIPAGDAAPERVATRSRPSPAGAAAR